MISQFILHVHIYILLSTIKIYILLINIVYLHFILFEVHFYFSRCS